MHVLSLGEIHKTLCLRDEGVFVPEPALSVVESQGCDVVERQSLWGKEKIC